VSSVAAEHAVSWPTVQRAADAHAAEHLPVEPAPTVALGIDETRRGKPTWVLDPTGRWVRRDPWDTGFVDLAGEQGLLGQVEGRSSASVVAWLLDRDPEWRSQVRWVAIDPHAGYAHAIRTSGLLPGATIVVDHFHLVQLANEAVTAVRRRVIWETAGRRGRKSDPPWANRRRLLTAHERLSEAGFARMWNGCLDSDPTQEVLTAYIAKEKLRALHALARTGATRRETSSRLEAFYRWCASTRIAELHTLATTVETWWPAVLAFLETGITNARTEGLNRLAKDVKRVACGFRNPEHQRFRVRLNCTRAMRERTA